MSIRESAKRFFVVITFSMILIFLVSCASEPDRKSNRQSPQIEIDHSVSKINDPGKKKDEVTYEFHLKVHRLKSRE
jgi:hypothetical protein